MTTLKDVAKIAKVNVSTVSRYLSGKLNVTPDTEQRILDAIQQTGYQPNLIARSLRSGSSPTIAILVPDIYQPGISGIISGIDDWFVDSEYTLVMMMTKGSAAREISVLRTLRHMMVAGVIVVGHPFREGNHVQSLKEAIGENIPMTFVSRNFRKSSVTEVCPDQEKGAMELTQHLINRNHRAIGVIVGSKNHPDARLKLRGYRKALSSAGIKVQPDWLEEGFYRPDATRLAVEKLIQRGIEALFCTSDLMAVSAAQYLQEQGLSIPGDVAVAGYGGTIWADFFSPKLTTVVVQVENLGRAAAELLAHKIQNPTEPPKFVIRPVYLRIGKTS